MDGATGSASGSATPVPPDVPALDSEVEPRPHVRRERRPRLHFAEHVEDAKRLLAFGVDEETLVSASAGILRPSLSAIRDGLRAHFEAAGMEPGAVGIFPYHTTDASEARDAEFRWWVDAVVNRPLDAALAHEVAGFAREHVRPRVSGRGRVRARYLLAAVSYLQDAFAASLSRSMSDAPVLASSIAAWNKLLMIHLDLLLAVYGATEANAHWY